MSSVTSNVVQAESRESGPQDRIVAAAIEVFGSYGFSKSTVQEIAAAAHVSKPLFYRHFKNKQDVFEFVIDRVFGDWHRAMIELVGRSEGSTSDSLRTLFLGTLEYARKRPLLNHLLTRDSQLLLSTQSDVWDRACNALRDLIEQLLRRGVESGDVRRDIRVEHIADLLTEINFTYTNRQLHTGIAVESDLAEAVAACVSGAVMPRH